MQKKSCLGGGAHEREVVIKLEEGKEPPDLNIWKKGEKITKNWENAKRRRGTGGRIRPVDER